MSELINAMFTIIQSLLAIEIAFEVSNGASINQPPGSGLTKAPGFNFTAASVALIGTTAVWLTFKRAVTTPENMLLPKILLYVGCAFLLFELYLVYHFTKATF